MSLTDTNPKEKKSKIPVHKDIIGRVLSIGDLVAASSNNSLKLYTIRKFSPKMVQIERFGSTYKSYSSKYPTDLIQVEKTPELTLFLLSNSKK